MYSRSGATLIPAGSSLVRATASSKVVVPEKYGKYMAPSSSNDRGTP